MITIDKKEILELIWHGKRYLCEEDCNCHTECLKATKYVDEIEPALSITGVGGASSDQLSTFCKHLNSYKGFEEIRFDFMLVDFLQKST